MSASNPLGNGAPAGQISPATPESIAVAADVLRGGGLVAVPTETVYGLAADAGSEAAVARIYTAKGRPDFQPPDRAHTGQRSGGAFGPSGDRWRTPWPMHFGRGR